MFSHGSLFIGNMTIVIQKKRGFKFTATSLYKLKSKLFGFPTVWTAQAEEVT